VERGCPFHSLANMKIRNATPSDFVSIAELHAASWRNTYAAVLSSSYLTQKVPAERKQLWKERLSSPKENQRVIVAEIQENVIGFACVFTENHESWGSYLDNLHVGEKYQGMGVGRALIGDVARWCESQRPGIGVYLSVNQDNLRAQRFYLNLGAHNAEPGIWNAPDGSKVPTYWFTWDSAGFLAESANFGHLNSDIEAEPITVHHLQPCKPCGAHL
jgi:ribosomal protein S18 acetylase RimI-like enzyme